MPVNFKLKINYGTALNLLVGVDSYLDANSEALSDLPAALRLILLSSSSRATIQFFSAS